MNDSEKISSLKNQALVAISEIRAQTSQGISTLEVVRDNFIYKETLKDNFSAIISPTMKLSQLVSDLITELDQLGNANQILGKENTRYEAQIKELHQPQRILNETFKEKLLAINNFIKGIIDTCPRPNIVSYSKVVTLSKMIESMVMDFGLGEGLGLTDAPKPTFNDKLVECIQSLHDSRKEMAQEFNELRVGEEMVNHPAHYNDYPIEVIDMMRLIWGDKEVRTFCIINAFKYRMRAGLKGDPAQDFNKEKWYLKMADSLEKGE